MGIRGLIEERRLRREGRRHIPPTAADAARDITGPTGSGFRLTWEAIERDGSAYLASFDRRLPPSTFVSERDRLRANLPMPLSERCIEDWGKPSSKPGRSQ